MLCPCLSGGQQCGVAGGCQHSWIQSRRVIAVQGQGRCPCHGLSDTLGPVVTRTGAALGMGESWGPRLRGDLILRLNAVLFLGGMC